MRITSFAVFSVSLLLCLPVSADIIESFDASGDNRDWGIDYGQWTQLFGSNYSGNGAQHSDTGGLSNTGYDYIDVDWVTGNWNLIFADADASGGKFAGNKDYGSIANAGLSAYVMRSSSNVPAATFFFVSEASGPTAGPNSTLWYYSLFMPATSWESQPRTAPMTSSTGWTAVIPANPTGGSPLSWAASIADVDMVGVMFIDADEGSHTDPPTPTPEMWVDDFTVTPEPGLLMTMAPLAGFLGWRLRRRKNRGTVQV